MNIITELFEEIRTLIKQLNKKIDEQQKGKSNQEVSIPIDLLDDAVVETMIKLTKIDLSDLKEMIRNLEIQNFKIQRTVATKVEEIKNIIDENTHQYHHYVFDLKSSKILFIILCLSLISSVSLTFNIIQHIENSRLENNDIKYRYIKMAGGASKANLLVLERVFNEASSKEMQEKFRTQVVNFEIKVQERAEQQEQANQKVQQVKQLTKEVEGLRGEK